MLANHPTNQLQGQFIGKFGWNMIHINELTPNFDSTWS